MYCIYCDSKFTMMLYDRTDRLIFSLMCNKYLNTFISAYVHLLLLASLDRCGLILLTRCVSFLQSILKSVELAFHKATF